MQNLRSRSCYRKSVGLSLLFLFLTGCTPRDVIAPVTAHPDGPVLAHAEPADVPVERSFFEDTRDIDPLRVTFPDWTLPPGYLDHVAVRAGQFFAHAIRSWRVSPPESAWLAEKAYLAAALAADTEGRFENPPGLPRLGRDTDANAAAAYIVAFTEAIERYDVSSDRAVGREAAYFRGAWLSRLGASAGVDQTDLARGIARGLRSADLVANAYPPLERARLQMPPDDFRRAIGERERIPAYDARQVWRFTPASENLERRPFNDYVPVAPGIGLLAPLATVARAEGTIPSFPAYGSLEWWDALEVVAKYGGWDSACRVEAQALIGWFFEASASGPPAEVANATTSVIAYLAPPIAEAARVQFLTWSAMATAGILTWHEKYRHNILRPVTAINSAVGEVAGVPDSWSWEALGPTPPFPAYPSGHAAFTPAAFLTLAMLLKDRLPDPMALRVTVASADPDSWSALMNEDGTSIALEFASFETLISAANESRGYLGIHWELDGIWGRYLGSLAAVRTHQQLMRSSANRTDAAIAFPKAPVGALDREDYNPATDWAGVTRSWAKHFPASVAALTGRDPSKTVAFPDLGSVDLPWGNACSQDRP